MWVVEITKTTGWINYIDVYALREQRAEKLWRCSRRLPDREIFISCLLCVDTITILYFVHVTELMKMQRPSKLTSRLQHCNKSICNFIRRFFVIIYDLREYLAIYRLGLATFHVFSVLFFFLFWKLELRVQVDQHATFYRGIYLEPLLFRSS